MASKGSETQVTDGGDKTNLTDLAGGKLVDRILVDLAHLAPLHDPVAVMVYNATRRDVTHVMVGEEFIVTDRHLTACDLPRVIREGQLAAEGVWRVAGLEAPAVGMSTHWPLVGGHQLEGASHD